MLTVSESTGMLSVVVFMFVLGLPLTSVISIEGEGECNRYK